MPPLPLLPLFVVTVVVVVVVVVIIIITLRHLQTFVANGYFADLPPKFSLTNAKLTIRQFLMVR